MLSISYQELQRKPLVLVLLWGRGTRDLSLYFIDESRPNVELGFG